MRVAVRMVSVQGPRIGWLECGPWVTTYAAQSTRHATQTGWVRTRTRGHVVVTLVVVVMHVLHLVCIGCTPR